MEDLRTAAADAESVQVRRADGAAGVARGAHGAADAGSEKLRRFDGTTGVALGVDGAAGAESGRVLRAAHATTGDC